MATLYQSLRKKAKESGSILITFAFLLPFLIGAMGMAVDLSNFYHQTREIQTAADSGAFAGALAFSRSEFGSIEPNCLADVAKHGFDGSNGETLTVNWPPLNGDLSGKTSAVEVIISQPVPTRFMRLFGFSELKATARSVGTARQGEDGIYVLENDGSESIEISRVR